MRARDEVLAAFTRGTVTRYYDTDAMAAHIAAVEYQRDEYHRMWKQEVLAKRALAERMGKVVEAARAAVADYSCGSTDLEAAVRALDAANEVQPDMSKGNNTYTDLVSDGGMDPRDRTKGDT